ncbi:hypothetical protein PHLCEN_2v1651 [Hermanssonia centrifuga]|uniref:Integrase catalytic domain-containing protein n=1 Tax=Hermanssonia centrifuga TaxID=98765 RepID=A0A2R6RZD7_9APHY|nr:hypothetical protein PHLCEN_2v1651 [Hermanssonia centrifuga]
MSTAYHPQTDGQTERVNQEIEQYLGCYCSYQRNDWVKWLPMAKFAINSQIHSAAGMLPFQAIYGYNPEFNVLVNPEFNVLVNLVSNVPVVDERLKVLKEAQDNI